MRVTKWNILYIEIFDPNLVFANIVAFKNIYCSLYTTNDSIMYGFPKERSTHMFVLLLDTP